MDEIERIGRHILDAAIAVHSELGPGLLESAYECCLAYELGSRGLEVKRQLALPVKYKGMSLDAGYRLDLLVNDCVLVELKAAERFSSLHLSQVLTYLRLTGLGLGYLLNFNVQHMKDGIKRVIYSNQ